MLKASIVAIGDELLTAAVLDTNTPWLAERLARNGVPLTSVQVVPDAVDAIGEAVEIAVAHSRPRLIVTSGGVGPTPDDVSYGAVARCLDRPLQRNPTIERNISRALSALAREEGVVLGDEAVRFADRMCLVPKGCRLLLPKCQWAPGVAIDIDGGLSAERGALIAMLPGVPEQFQRLVLESIEPECLRGRNPVPHSAHLCHDLPESVVSPLMEELTDRFPGVQVGSYPSAEQVSLNISGPLSQVEPAANWLARKLNELRSTVDGQRLASWRAKRTHDDL